MTLLRRRPRGIALIIVLWMLALLTVIASSMVYSLRSDVQVAGNQTAAARAEAAADAGVHRAILELTRPATDTTRWQPDGLGHPWQFAGFDLSITLLDEAGRIDLNGAPPTLLAGLFRAQGVDEERALRLADAVADWRDADDLPGLHGAEREDYLAAGLDHGPRNGNFETVDELRMVLGIDEALFRQVAQLLTVYSGRPGVDSSVAPRGVLLAFPGVVPEQVDAYLAERESVLARGLPVPPAPFAQGVSTNRLGNTVSIQVHAKLGENVAFFREAVVRVTRDPKTPTVILAWRAPRVARGQ